MIAAGDATTPSWMIVKLLLPKPTSPRFNQIQNITDLQVFFCPQEISCCLFGRAAYLPLAG
jgi:hypothetical protein